MKRFPVSCCLLALLNIAPPCPAVATLPTLKEVIASKLDLWGEAAMKAPNGPSYEFFEPLLPPPRYVNADFRYYPIVLSAPNAISKARLISNGSGVNLRGGTRSWNEAGTPFTFRVGPDELRFGDILNRVEHPVLLNGYLPIVQIRYSHASEIYQLEAFAATEPSLSKFGVILVRFSLISGTNGLITVDADAPAMKFAEGKLLSEGTGVLAACDPSWKWERKKLHAKVQTNQSATLAIYTKPSPENTAIDYESCRSHCVETWEKVLATGMQFHCAESRVNNACRNLIIQNFSLTFSNRLCYSAGNQYEKMYAAETSDAAVPLLWWGYAEDMRRFLPVILGLTDKRLPHHFAGHKLEALCEFYRQTADLEFVSKLRPAWQKELELLLADRSPENGLLSKENYCTDIEVPVYSFPANAIGWSALRDVTVILRALGDSAQSEHVKASARELRRSILAAVEKNTDHSTQPPFVPMALFYGEETHDPITHNRLGSYWDLVANYVIGSRIFAGTEKEEWFPRFFETHGGLLMGLTRSAATNHTFWTGTHRTNPLYGMRYNLDTLRRDEVDRALVGFYGMLAHGLTRNTFIGAEGCSVEPLDEGGRFFYCPPNSAANGQWLATLRHMLVQDWDADGDGTADGLNLCFGTPRAWLEDGKTISLQNAPTAFGPISLTMESRLNQGEVRAQVQLPSREQPKRAFLRARVPDGWQVAGASANEKNLPFDKSTATADITQLSGKVSIVFKVER